MRRVTTCVDGSGVAVGFVARHGAAVAELERARSLRPTRCAHLGDAPAEAPPALARVGGRLVAAWVDLDGAHVGYLGERGHRLADAAHAIDLAATRAGLHVVVAGDALTLHDLDRALAPRVAPAVLLERRDVRAPSLHAAGGELLLAYVLDDPALVVHRLGVDGGSVRHPLDAVPLTLCGAAVPGTLAIALDFGAGRVEHATFDRAGRTKERLHPLRRGALASPSVCWVGDEFAIGALELDRGRYALARADGRAVVAREGIEHAPWVAAYHDRQLLLSHVVRDEALDRLILHSVREDGEAQRHEVDVTPDDTSARAHRAAARLMLRQVVELAPTLGYRGEVRARRSDERAVELAFETTTARVRLDERDEALELVLAVGRDRAPEVGEPSRGWRAWWRRVAPWARAIVGPTARDAGEDEGGAWLRVELETIPEAREVLAWLRALAERVGG